MHTRRFLGYPRQVAILAAALTAGAGFGLAFEAHEAFTHPPASIKMANPNEGPSGGFAPIVKRTLPSVVNISSSKVTKTSKADGMGQMQMDPLFQQFFGGNAQQFNNVPKERREQALGSGVIVAPEGYILTNNHVIDGATDIQVTLSDRRQFKAQLVGTDPHTDIAILKIDASNLTPITLADSSKVQVGDYALAIGDPFGVGQTVTAGIISAKGRSLGGQIEDYEDFLQTDAPINPGNSGGALINDRGELIGINTAILSHGSDGNVGLGFAVPVNLARTVMHEILTTGKVTRGYLGIVPQDVTPSIAKAFNEQNLQGALVGDVSADSPAQHGGLLKGDIILKVNGTSVEDANQLRMQISMMAPGSEAHLKVMRDGTERDLTVKLGELPSETADAKTPASSNDNGNLEGLSVQNLSADSAHQLGLPSDSTGVVVTDISPSSPLVDSGLQQGDVIQEVNHHQVKDTAQFREAMQHSTGSDTLLLVNRHGSTLYVAA